LKPIDPADLKMAIDRIAELKERVMADNQIIELQQNMTKTPDKIVLPTQEAMYVVKLDQIVRCETSGSYTKFYIADGREIIVSKPMKSYEEILVAPDFFRIHHSHLININCIESYSREGMVKMNDKKEVPIARAKKDPFFRLMKEGL
jgi:two-component system LytT family response regulator